MSDNNNKTKTHIRSLNMVWPLCEHFRGHMLGANRTHMHGTVFLFFFIFMAISVIAGADYLEGPINRPYCVALKLQRGKKRGGRTRIVDMKWLQIHHGSEKESRWCISHCNARLGMRICQKLQRVLEVLPTPILPNKSLAASATFGHRLWAPITGDGNHLDPRLETRILCISLSLS